MLECIGFPRCEGNSEVHSFIVSLKKYWVSTMCQVNASHWGLTMVTWYIAWLGFLKMNDKKCHMNSEVREPFVAGEKSSASFGKHSMWCCRNTCLYNLTGSVLMEPVLTQALHPGSRANGMISSRSRLISFHEFRQEDVVKSQLGG